MTDRSPAHAGPDTTPRSIVLLLLIGSLLLIPVHVALSPDDEGLWSDIVPTAQYVHDLARGQSGLWNSYSGFGMPHAPAQNLDYHPLSYLLLFLPLRFVLTLLFQVHLWIGMVGTWLLCRHYGVANRTALLCATVYASSTASIQYFLVDFWPVIMISWSLLPLLLYAAARLTAAKKPRELRLWAAALALVTSFMILHGHLGVLASVFLGVSFSLLCRPLPVLRRWRWFAMSALLVAATSLSKLYELHLEYARFPATDPRPQQHVALSAWKLFLYPLAAPDLASYGSWGKQDLGFGGVFALLCLASVLYLRELTGRRHLLASLLLCGLFWFVPVQSVARVFSANYFIRDPLILYAIVIAGLCLDIVRRRYRHGRAFAAVLATCQIVMLAAGLKTVWAWNLQLATEPSRRGNLAKVLRDGEIIAAAKRLSAAAPGRFYMSEGAEKHLYRNLANAHFAAFPINGLRLVNGKFKGVDYSAIHPNRAVMLAQLRACGQAVLNKPALDVLGIRYVFAERGERVAPGLKMAREFKLASGAEVVLYTNEEARQDLSLTPTGGKDAAAEGPNPVCGHGAALCQDWAGFARALEPDGAITVTREGSSLAATVQPLAALRGVFFAEAYRPGWKIEARNVQGDLLSRQEMRESPRGFMVTEIPADTRAVRVFFSPGKIVALRLLSLTVLAGTAAAVLILKR